YYRQRLLETGQSQAQTSEWLSLEAVIGGMFDLAERLWGLRFVLREDLPAWHPQMKAYEVLDRSGATAGIVYLDPIHRHGKRGGAWTSQYRVQAIDKGRRTAPVLAVVANLAPARDGQPTLLTADQVRTLFHELGHVLHGLLSDVEHPALAGTNVPPDFVEFPALLLERWSLDPQVVGRYARHYQSGDTLGRQAAAALAHADRPTPGLETLELIAAIELDLALHGTGNGQLPDLETAEKRVRERLALPAMVSPRHHGGGLASVFARQRHGGDFRTLWSEVLASDAFAAFARQGVVDGRLAERLRAEILARGNSRSPMESWWAFRGRAPDIGHLIEARGLSGYRSEGIAGDQAGAKTPSGE
ncbi:MAG TPA: M3 family metallopeptidase, partial [Wenzhouxiangella sp.]|nr:M3 family metallopeptidase [Wenzhouxiangella sp.]